MDIRTICNTTELVGSIFIDKAKSIIMVPCADNYTAERNWSVQSRTLLKVVRSNLLLDSKRHDTKSSLRLLKQCTCLHAILSVVLIISITFSNLHFCAHLTRHSLNLWTALKAQLLWSLIPLSTCLSHYLYKEHGASFIDILTNFWLSLNINFSHHFDFSVNPKRKWKVDSIQIGMIVLHR